MKKELFACNMSNDFFKVLVSVEICYPFQGISKCITKSMQLPYFPGCWFSLSNFHLKYIYQCNILSQKPGVQPNKSVQQLMTKRDEKFLL